MPRIRLPSPERILFSTDITVCIGDINYGNHLANDALLRLMHEARLRWLASGGFSETDAGGCGLIMADAAVQYLAQAYRSDVLRFDLGIGETTRAGFILLAAVRRIGDGTPVALIQNGMVFFDYAAQRTAAMPAAFQAFIA
ncbi:thioesterase family protein [Neisseria leonii]|uniref:Thioesterase family protein n=1 Tax=Neisseria leonii TaxID=2995413 RepID=A0A9X4E2M8_9NEIS|nr:thioesterase family protein [Neisseria sp. 51.81]MDD9328477.1 thioesterase family protein [Neisseria sp. 51.81]